MKNKKEDSMITLSLEELKKYTEDEKLIEAFIRCFNNKKGLIQKKDTGIIDEKQQFSLDKYQSFIYQYEYNKNENKHGKRFGLNVESKFIQLISDIPMDNHSKIRYLQEANRQIERNIVNISESNRRNKKVKITNIAEEHINERLFAETAVVLTRQQYQIDEALNLVANNKVKKM